MRLLPTGSLALALVAGGCGGSGAAPEASGDVVVRTWLEGLGSKGGTLVVQVETLPDLSISLPEPQVRGLKLDAAGEAQQERIGDRLVLTRRYRVSGPEGRYEIGSLEVHWGQDQVAGSSPLFFDLGDLPALDSGLADIEGPEPIVAHSWTVWLVAGGIGVGAVAGAAGLAVWLGSRREPEPEPVPPDVRALLAWEAAWRDDALDAYAKAVEINRIFRAYTEEVLGFPAVSWTSTEILDQLGRMENLVPANVPRAKRILRATDRVKYAEAPVGEDFFEELDADLRAFVDATRPLGWE